MSKASLLSLNQGQFCLPCNVSVNDEKISFAKKEFIHEVLRCMGKDKSQICLPEDLPPWGYRHKVAEAWGKVIEVQRGVWRDELSSALCMHEQASWLSLGCVFRKG
jgi:hypothetical protein